MRLIFFFFNSMFYLLEIRTRSSHRRCPVEKVFLKILQISEENTWFVVFFNKVTGLQAYFEEHLWTAKIMLKFYLTWNMKHKRWILQFYVTFIKGFSLSDKLFSFLLLNRKVEILKNYFLKKTKIFLKAAPMISVTCFLN